MVAEAKGVQLVIERVVGQLRGLGQRVDELVERLFEGQLTPTLHLDPTEPLAARVDALIAYMTIEGIGMEDRVGGFRDYLMETLTTADGLPAALPTSTNPRVLDAWIDGDVIPVSHFPG
jgi:hypothetical protein